MDLQELKPGVDGPDGPAVDRPASAGMLLLSSRDALFDPLTLIPRPLEEYF